MTTMVLYGGSFNPPHQGHVAVAKWLLEHFDKVLIAPVVNHAFNKDLFPFETRAKWFKDSVSGEIEIVHSEDRYTIDLVERLQERVGPLALVVGSDILTETQRWHRWDDLIKIVEILVVARKGVPMIPHSFRTIQVDAAPEISSSQLRQYAMTGNHKALRHYLQPMVADDLIRLSDLGVQR